MFARNTVECSRVPKTGMGTRSRFAPRRSLALVITLTFALHVFAIPRPQDVSAAALDGAVTHLAAEMDRYHTTFDVYSDAGAGGNHFSYYAKIADDFNAVDINLCSSEKVHSGMTAIKSTFQNTTGQNWGGWYALNGVLTGQDTSPRANFGETPNAGVDLTGATQISFWAVGSRGGEKVEFFVGGVGRNPVDGSPVASFPDSTPRAPSIGTTVTLSTSWTRYSISLAGKNLSYILGGFAWICSAVDNPAGATCWIDDVQYDRSRPDEPRFIRSYVTLSGNAFDKNNRDVAFAYDNAMAMLALMSRGQADDWRRAGIIASAFLYAQANDPTYSDGRIRNAYESGDVMFPPGWSPNGKVQAVRLPVVADCDAGTVGFDRTQVSSYTGNVAWVGIALLTYYQKTGSAKYLDAARRMGEWIEGRRQAAGLGGYRGGVEGFDRPSAEHPNDPVEVPWSSTEHNLDIIALANTLFQITGETTWKDRADHARSFVGRMWDQNIGCLLVGATDSQTLNRDLLALDAQPWSVLAIQDALTQFPNVLQCAETHHRTTKDGFTGYDFNDDRDGIWFEGTAQMALAWQRAGNASKAGEILDELRRAQSSAANANGLAIPAASRDGVTTGFVGPDMLAEALFNRLHIGASAWYVLAETRKNPYALFGSVTPRIASLTVNGKKLIVLGEGFDDGAVIVVNGNDQATTNDSTTPTQRLIGKKAGKKIRPGDKVKVRNADGSESGEVEYAPAGG